MEKNLNISEQGSCFSPDTTDLDPEFCYKISVFQGRGRVSEMTSRKSSEPI